MSKSELPDKLKHILGQTVSREAKATPIVEAIRDEGEYRWVGIYDVDIQHGQVLNVAWSGPSAPAHPIFPITKGITSKAIAGRKTINVGDVANDPDYLTALGSTQAEIIIPVLDRSGDRVIGTIDVESEHMNAFNSATQALLEECARVIRGFWTGGD